MEKNSQFRDVFNPEVISQLGQRIQKVYQEFNTELFLKSAVKNISDLSFSERNLQIAAALKKCLPANFEKAVEVILKSQTNEIDSEELEGRDGFIVMPQTLFISDNGMENLELSLHALEEMTKRFTSEFAIRFFIRNHREFTLSKMKEWAVHPNCHIRRLASEGSRPRLPWGMRLNEFIKDPNPVLEILEIMKFSPERLVQRSIANNLNDISKDNPEAVIKTLKKWQEDGVDNWLINHALRTLFKQGNPDALKLSGFDPEAEIHIKNFKVLTETVEFGNSLEFEFDVESPQRQIVMIDYVIHHMKANGTLSPKVFKMAKKAVSGHSKAYKKHPIKPITTRKYYPGRHLVQIQVNGKVCAESEFTLVM